VSKGKEKMITCEEELKILKKEFAEATASLESANRYQAEQIKALKKANESLLESLEECEKRCPPREDEI
jgi:predicted HicB family RNase H-like nuclease